MLPALLAVITATGHPPIPDRLVVLTFDDAAKSHYTVARPLLLKHKFGATFFVTEGWDFATNKTDYMTWAEIAQLHRDGFEVGNHTRDHLAVTDKTVGDLSAQVRAINARCQEHGIPQPVSFAYPGNALTKAALPVLKELGVKFARRGGSPEYPYKEGRGFAYEPGRDHPLLVPTAGDARPTWTLDDLKRAVSQAKDGKVAVLQFHGVPDTAHDWVNTRKEQFEAFLTYLAEEKYTVVALRDLAKYVDPDVVPADPFAVIEDRKKRVGGKAESPVDFQREVQPILAEHCTHCHGVDAKQRKAKLRLDTRDGAVTGGSSGTPAIVPGQPDKSELMLRVTSHDEGAVMPPPEEKKPLTDAQRATLRRWITEGAKYQAHWAFTPPKKAEPPRAGHPIDAFVRARLEREKLSPAAPAPPAALARRLYLDLTGLPPSPAELAAFERDGIDKTVEKLLASDRFGEKWARHWLDLARYSDTNGYEKDMPREMWAWRDWVVDALNRDMPYDRFLVEQLAGDLLPGATQSQRVATGFLRNSMINEEGAIVPEQFRMVEMFDRLDCVGKAVLGLTTQCAQCHSHKFDPLTHHEYFGLFAFLNNTYEAQSWVYTPDQLKQIDGVREKVRTLEARVRETRPKWEAELAAWAKGVVAQQVPWTPLEGIEMGSVSGLNHPTQEADKSFLMKGHTSDEVFFVATPALNGVTGLRLEALTHRDLPHDGPGRSRVGGWSVKGIDVFVQKPDGKTWDKLKLVNATADFAGLDPKHAATNLVDGKDDTAWVSDRGHGQRNQPSAAVVQFEKPLDYPAGTKLKVSLRMGDMLGCARLSLTTALLPSVPPVDHAAVLALRGAPWARTAAPQQAVFAAWRRSVPELKALNEEIDAAVRSLPVATTTVLHLAEREPDDPRRTHLLARGEWDQPGEVVPAGTPAALHPFLPIWPRNRLGFAQWLTDRRSPLTARVAVNQTWQAIFGTGLVETAEDFGTRAPVPEHRELLDWLAVDFMDHGWSRKHLIRTIVSSATYRQSSAATKELLARDPKNRLLARGARFRADAETVRDIALSVSGLLTHQGGGPSVYPPVPKSVLDYNYTYPGYWKPAAGPDRYRRSLYVFRKRSMPDPLFAAFDGPNGDCALARRPRSNTPLAALTGLNEPVFVEAARALALRVLREGGTDDAERVGYAFRLCVARPPTEGEREEVLNLLRGHRQRLADGWLSAREVATGDAATLPALPDKATPQDAAAWTLVARVLLNLDETITKN